MNRISLPHIELFFLFYLTPSIWSIDLVRDSTVCNCRMQFFQQMDKSSIAVLQHKLCPFQMYIEGQNVSTEEAKFKFQQCHKAFIICNPLITLQIPLGLTLVQPWSMFMNLLCLSKTKKATELGSGDGNYFYK